jgi:hypothetical protein
MLEPPVKWPTFLLLLLDFIELWLEMELFWLGCLEKFNLFGLIPA